MEHPSFFCNMHGIWNLNLTVAVGSLVSGRYRITWRPNIRFSSEFYPFLRYSGQLLAVGNPFFLLSRASIGGLLLAGYSCIITQRKDTHTHTRTHTTARQPRRLKLGFMEDFRACFRAQWGFPAPIHLTAARCAQESYVCTFNDTESVPICWERGKKTYYITHYRWSKPRAWCSPVAHFLD